MHEVSHFHKLLDVRWDCLSLLKKANTSTLKYDKINDDNLGCHKFFLFALFVLMENLGEKRWPWDEFEILEAMENFSSEWNLYNLLLCSIFLLHRI